MLICQRFKQSETNWKIGAMLKGLPVPLTAGLFFAFAAPTARAEVFDVICSNVDALNTEFVSLFAKHLDFEPRVMINPGPQDHASNDNVRTVRFVISGKEYETAIECAGRLGFKRDEIDRRIHELRRRLGKEGVPLYPNGPRGNILSHGEGTELNGRILIITVSVDEDLVTSAGAVLRSHGFDGRECWVDTDCLAEVENYWSMGAN